MGRNPPWPRLAVARGMNMGNCSSSFSSHWHGLLALLRVASLLVEEGSRSTSKLHLLLYAPQSHSVLLDSFPAVLLDNPGELYYRT
jgi:hypothetical protein